MERLLMPLNKEVKTPDAPEQGGGDIQTEYSSDLLCRPNIGAITTNYL
jgi:hypothetical protein